MAEDPPDPREEASDRDLPALLAGLHRHLEATEELPIDPAANRWIGEAQAVAADLHRDPDPPDAVVRDRVGHVRDLLERMGDPGHPEARTRVDAARDIADEIAARLA